MKTLYCLNGNNSSDKNIYTPSGSFSRKKHGYGIKRNYNKRNQKIFEVQSAPREDWGGGGGGKLLSTSAEEESANLLNNIGVVDCGIRLFSSGVYFPG